MEEKDSKRIRFYHIDSEDLDILEILNSTEADNGQYRLKAENDGGRVSAEVIINVLNPQCFEDVLKEEWLTESIASQDKLLGVATTTGVDVKEAVNEKGKKTKKRRLKQAEGGEEKFVYRKPAPCFDVMPAPQSLVEGEDIKLECKASGM